MQIVRIDCAAAQGTSIQESAFLGTTEYFINGEPNEQGLKNYFTAIDLLWGTFQPPVNSEEDRDTVDKFFHRCIDVGESFGQPFDMWLLSYIGRVVLEVSDILDVSFDWEP
jgi:hypothetical protein